MRKMSEHVDEAIRAMSEVLNLIRRVRADYPDAPAKQIAEAVTRAYDAHIEEVVERIQQLQLQFDELQQHKNVVDAMANIVRLSDHRQKQLRVAAE